MEKNKKILIIYDYFDPAFKAGGPITSCVNIVQSMNNDFDFIVFSSRYDLAGEVLKVESNSWVNYCNNTKVYYSTKGGFVRNLNDVFRYKNPDVIYLNGVFSLRYVFMPLLMVWVRKLDQRIIISSRGMLQENALKTKALKKKIYLFFLRLILSKVKVLWHVTSQGERIDIFKVLPGLHSRDVFMVGNIPSINITKRESYRIGAQRKFVTVSLVSPMKNISNVILAFSHVKEDVLYTIYGPIKDSSYWEKCLELIAELPTNIRVVYKGAIKKEDVANVLAKHDIYIQPSKSENFGHSIFQALMVGLPVITSLNTPWFELSADNAGWVVNTMLQGELENAIIESIKLNNTNYSVMSDNARHVADNYLALNDFRSKYLKLFN